MSPTVVKMLNTDVTLLKLTREAYNIYRHVHVEFKNGKGDDFQQS